MPTTHLDPIQAGAQITRENFHWGTTLGAATGPITFGFRQSTTSNNDTTEKNTFSAFTAQEMAAAEIILRQWASLAKISFTEINPSSYTNSATMLFANYFSTSDGAQAYTYFPSSNNQAAISAQGDVWLNRAHESTTSLPFGSYDFLTLIHEIGHALGLDHPGDYNAGPGQTITYANSALYVEDTRQYTVMSYFAASNTGANHVYNGQTIYASTPLLDDITAIQRLYGANTNYATGNTVYGFNSNADSSYHISSSTQQVVYCIWDGGGGDTLDCSGYSTNQLIDLIPGTFSNVGALTMNVSIALGTIIESAIGGSGNDTFYGNSANNIIDGHGGSDTVIFTGAHNQYLVTSASDGSIQLADLRAGAPDGTDILINVEFIKFNDGIYSVNQLATTINTSGGPGDDVLSSSAGVAGQVSFAPWVEWGHGVTASDQVVDVNGDGRADLVQFYNGRAVVALSNGVQFGVWTDWATGVTSADKVVDVNGDGRADIVQFYNGRAVVALSNGSGFGAWMDWAIGVTPTDQVVDVNGDGKPDIIQFYNGRAVVALSTGSSFGAWTDWATGVTSSDRVVDVNGDGLADIVQFYNGRAVVALNNGSGFGAWADWASGVTSTEQVVDVNGDGKADIVQFYNGRAVVALSTGSSFGAWTDWATGVTSTDKVVDVTGDHRADLVQFYNGRVVVGQASAPIIGGNDTLTGGSGHDTFVFNLNFGRDVVTDFTPGGDILQFDQAVFADAATALAHTANDGLGNAVITYDAYDFVTLQHVATASLSMADFHIV